MTDLKEGLLWVRKCFAESEAGAKVFGGAEAASGVAAHAKKIKAEGAAYCECPACAAVEKILEKKEEILA